MYKITLKAMAVILVGYMSQAALAQPDDPPPARDPQGPPLRALVREKYDRNDNGTLDPQERERLEKDLMRFDRNDDGKLSPEERQQGLREMFSRQTGQARPRADQLRPNRPERDQLDRRRPGAQWDLDRPRREGEREEFGDQPPRERGDREEMADRPRRQRERFREELSDRPLRQRELEGMFERPARRGERENLRPFGPGAGPRMKMRERFGPGAEGFAGMEFRGRGGQGFGREKFGMQRPGFRQPGFGRGQGGRRGGMGDCDYGPGLNMGRGRGMGPGREMGMGPGWEGDGRRFAAPLRPEFRARRDIERPLKKPLKEADRPKPSPEKKLNKPKAGEARPKTFREKIIREFDRNKDGRLDEDERAKLMEFLQK